MGSSLGGRWFQQSEFKSRSSKQKAHYSVTEVEIVVRVGVVFALTENRADEVEGTGGEGNSHPDFHAVVHDDTVDEEALEASVHEVEEPLLSRVGAMVPDVASTIGCLLVEVLVTVPRTHLHLRRTHTLTVTKAHILGVSLFVVGQATSCLNNKQRLTSATTVSKVLTLDIHSLLDYINYIV